MPRSRPSVTCASASACSPERTRPRASARASAASPVGVVHLMAFPFRHEFGGAVQALFRLDHGAGGEAIFAASVLAEFDQIGRIAHRAHHLVELVDPVAVPVRELRHVAPREGRLLMRDRVQPKRRIGDDPRAIAARDLAVHLGAVGLDPFALDAVCAGAPIWLCGSSAMPCASRLRWSMRASMSSSASRSLASSAQRSRQRSTISVRFQSRTFGPKPFSSTARMVSMTWAWGLGMPSSADVPMHIEIGDHAPIHELRLREVAGQFDALRLRQSRAEWRIRPRGQAGRPCGFRTPRHRSRAVRGRSMPPAHSPAASPRNGRRRAWRKSRGCDQAARRAAASPSGRRLTPPRWSRTCGQ